MSTRIKPNEIQQAVERILQTYSDNVISQTKEIVDEVTKDALKQVKSHAPTGRGSKSRKRGTYKRHIASRTSYESLTEKRNTIYVKDPEFRLAHLLEKGHRLHQGGHTSAHPHFEYGENVIDKELKKKITEAIEKGG